MVAGMGCSGCSPRRIFRGRTTEWLLASYETMSAIPITGRFTSLAGQNHSSTNDFGGMSAEDTLFEIVYELGLRGVAGFTNPPTTVYQNFQGLRPMPGTITTSQL